LVVTRDEALLDELLRLASAGGVEVTVAVDALAAEDEWPSTPLVVVGADRVGEVARRGLPPRMGVVVAGMADPLPWAEAEALHAEHVVLLPDARPWLVARFAEHGRARGPAQAALAPVVAVLAGSAAAVTAEISATLTVTAGRQGLTTMLVAGVEVEPDRSDQDESGSRDVGFLDDPVAGARVVVLTYPRSGSGVPPEAMAAALSGGRECGDLVVVDLPTSLDGAGLLALTCADRGYLVVPADVRSCAAAARVAATARRHCPALSLIVQSVGHSGLRPREVAEALNLRLTATLPLPAASAAHPGAGFGGGPLGRLNRRILADLGVGARPVRIRHGALPQPHRPRPVAP
jgi:secretion/DNA translocation related CpaE-like protein